MINFSHECLDRTSRESRGSRRNTLCPQCSHACLDGTVFCDDCGCDLSTIVPQNLPVAVPRLVVVRGVKPNEEFPLWEGKNVIGRTDEKPVDINLDAQEPPDRLWVSRQHACINLSGGVCTIEDIASGNGTFVNRGPRLQVGQQVELRDGDIIQISTVHLRYVV